MSVRHIIQLKTSISLRDAFKRRLQVWFDSKSLHSTRCTPSREAWPTFHIANGYKIFQIFSKTHWLVYCSTFEFIDWPFQFGIDWTYVHHMRKSNSAVDVCGKQWAQNEFHTKFTFRMTNFSVIFAFAAFVSTTRYCTQRIQRWCGSRARE